MQNNIVRLICQHFTPSGFLSSGTNFKDGEYFDQINCLSMIKTRKLKEMGEHILNHLLSYSFHLAGDKSE